MYIRLIIYLNIYIEIMRKITKVVREIVFMIRFARTPSLEHDQLYTVIPFVLSETQLFI